MEWKTETEYKIDDCVRVYSVLYKCIRDHKSNVFADDLHGKHTVQKQIESCWKKI